MARKYTKCAGCGDLLWFGDNDVVPQTVICPCNETTLTEGGPEGNYTEPSAEEIASMT